MNLAQLRVGAYTIPTETPEADGTIAWQSTSMVLVEAQSEDGTVGLGYSYAAPAAGLFIEEKLAPLVIGRPVHAIGAAWERMVKAVRNVGRPGIAAHAISAVDTALWDLKARVLGLPLFHLLPTHRDSVPVYGSGGFTSYSVERLQEQLAGWVEQGIPRVKMKLGKGWGRVPEEDVQRVLAARRAIGPDAELMVDANGAYTAKQAVRQARRFAEFGVTYFEEPVSSDHLRQLAFVRNNTVISIAAGEYGYDPWYFRDMLQAGAVDILQADVTRCLGISGWLMAADIAYGFAIPLSAHTAPSIHAHIGCAAPQISHVEYFFDHVRIEKLFFDGFLEPLEGTMVPDPDRPGLGLTLKREDVQQYQIRPA
ncbi:MAG: enolase C-terminal domain-like protein [Candidatus Promineifilaceae bacterium]|nr:enolase C-terminal domain-like protein [Candidatus Promineifilaceae bacterium]